MQRRLAAILAADVAGYSRLMGTDEVGTLTALKAHRRQIVDPGIAEHHGRIVKTTGDGMLVEFASVVDAVACAVNVQRADGQAQRASSGRQADRVPDRHQCRRHHHRRRRHFRRRRQHRRPSRSAVRARRRLHLARGQRRGQGQALAVLCRSRRAGGEEHRARRRRLRAGRARHRGTSGQCGAGRHRAGPRVRRRRAGDPLLPDQGRRAARLGQDRPGSADRQDRQLDDASGISIWKARSGGISIANCRAITHLSATTRAATACPTATCRTSRSSVSWTISKPWSTPRASIASRCSASARAAPSPSAMRSGIPSGCRA